MRTATRLQQHSTGQSMTASGISTVWGGLTFVYKVYQSTSRWQQQTVFRICVYALSHKPINTAKCNIWVLECPSGIEMAELPYDLGHLLDSSSAGQMRVVAGADTKQRTATSQAGSDSEVETDHFNNNLRSSPCCT